MLILVGVFSTGVINWVILSSYRSEELSQVSSNIKQQSEDLIQVLLRDNFFSVDKSVQNQQNQWEISKSIAVMENTYADRILLLRGSDVIFDSEQSNNLSIVSNCVIDSTDNILSNEDFSALNDAFSSQSSISYETNGFLACVIPVKDDAALKEDANFVLVTSDLTHILSGYRNTREKILTLEVILLVLLILFAFFYSGSVIKPLRELAAYIGRITDGYLNEKVTMKSFSEVEDVVDSINSMTTKLETLESSRQEFVSNVSHELKTPITSIKVLADSLLQQEDAPAELYREFLSDINAEIERENKIITDLLSLVKMDKTSSELNISSININELCEQILKRIKPIAAKRNIELIFESYRPVLAEVDEVKLSLAINNLIENAVKYNYDDGWVRVSLNADHKFFYIKVADSGVGIPEDEQENVFERFYRVDKARSRETGGTGLGLSITRNAILMHRGAIKIYSKEKEGTTFTVRIPLTYIN